MKGACQVGDLVHIPQAVRLLHYDDASIDKESPWQLRFPQAMWLTEKPELGLVISPTDGHGELRVYCVGKSWSVKNKSVYKLGILDSDKVY